MGHVRNPGNPGYCQQGWAERNNLYCHSLHVPGRVPYLPRHVEAAEYEDLHLSVQHPASATCQRNGCTRVCQPMHRLPVQPNRTRLDWCLLRGRADCGGWTGAARSANSAMAKTWRCIVERLGRRSVPRPAESKSSGKSGWRIEYLFRVFFRHVVTLTRSLTKLRSRHLSFHLFEGTPPRSSSVYLSSSNFLLRLSSHEASSFYDVPVTRGGTWGGTCHDWIIGNWIDRERVREVGARRRQVLGPSFLVPFCGSSLRKGEALASAGTHQNLKDPRKNRACVCLW